MANEEHPARVAARRSMEAVHAKDKDAWVANFADDGVVEDPIGRVDLRSRGNGSPRQGGDRGVLGQADRPEPRLLRHPRVLRLRQRMRQRRQSVNTVLPNGAIMIVNGVFTYRVDAYGKVLALRAYWEMGAMKSVPADGAQ